MTPNDPLPNVTLKTDPMLANIGEVTESHFELVFIFGYIGEVTDDTVQLYQGLDLRRYYEIPRREIVHVASIGCVGGPSTQLVLYSTTRITYVSNGATATLPASSLAAAVAATNKPRRETESPSPQGCPAGCLCNGICRCATVDYWLRLDEATARRLDVMVLCAAPGSRGNT
jgi:hypothetical protein